MLISFDNNIALLAMPKTGTTAVETALAPHCDLVFQGAPRNKHLTLRKFDRFVRPYAASLGFDALETACVFREPADWLGSWFRYRSRPQIAGSDNSTAGMDFESFVAAYMDDDPPSFARVGRPSRFVTGAEGESGVDHLFRYDEFDRYLGFLADRFGMPVILTKVNASPDRDLALSRNMRARLERHMAAEYAIYESIGVNGSSGRP